MKKIVFLYETVEEKKHVFELREKDDSKVKEISVTYPAYKHELIALIDLLMWAEDEGYRIEGNSDFIMSYPDMIGEYKRVSGSKHYNHKLEANFQNLAGRESFFYYWKNEHDYFQCSKEREKFQIIHYRNKHATRERVAYESGIINLIKRLIHTK